MRILKVRYGKGEKFPKYPWAVVTSTGALVAYCRKYMEARAIVDKAKKKAEEGKPTDKA